MAVLFAVFAPFVLIAALVGVFRRGTVTPDRLPKVTRQIEDFVNLINGICAVWGSLFKADRVPD